MKICAIICFIFVCFSSNAFPPGYTIQNSGRDSHEFNCVHQSTGKVVELTEILRVQGLEHSRELPCSEESFAAYLKQYLESSQSDLDYASNFWEPVRRSSAELEFCCLKETNFAWWLCEVRIFCSLIVADNHRFFKSEVIKKYFDAWKDVFESFKSTVITNKLDDSRVTSLSAELNSLLDIINKGRTLITWSF